MHQNTDTDSCDNVAENNTYKLSALIDEVLDKAYDLGFEDGKEVGYEDGCYYAAATGEEEHSCEDDCPICAEKTEEEAQWCAFEAKVNEVVESVRSLLLNDADVVNIKYTTYGEFVVTSERNM